jgi:hypothetical protein
MILPSETRSTIRQQLPILGDRVECGDKKQGQASSPRCGPGVGVGFWTLRALPPKSVSQAPYRAPTLDIAKDLDRSISASMALALLGWKKTLREFVDRTPF